MAKYAFLSPQRPRDDEWGEDLAEEERVLVLSLWNVYTDVADGERVFVRAPRDAESEPESETDPDPERRSDDDDRESFDGSGDYQEES